MPTPPSASGYAKVILLGEHAVVYGQPALAAALSLGVRAERVANDGALRVEVPAWSVTARPEDGTRLGEALAAMVAVVERHAGEPPEGLLRVTFEVPIGAGLGSSAAMAVALARVMRPEAGDAFVLEAAAASERVFHGNPSGVDHTTSTVGGILRFTRGGDPPCEPLTALAPLPLLIAQMEPGADTGEMVAGVRARLDREPEIVTQLLEWMGALTRHAESALSHGDAPRLGELMDLAHGALVSLGVSTAALDRGCHAARRAGAWGAKLTGAGGGGCLIALAPEASQAAVAAALEAEGAMRVLTTWAGAGRPST